MVRECTTKVTEDDQPVGRDVDRNNRTAHVTKVDSWEHLSNLLPIPDGELPTGTRHDQIRPGRDRRGVVPSGHLQRTLRQSPEETVDGCCDVCGGSTERHERGVSVRRSGARRACRGVIAKSGQLVEIATGKVPVSPASNSRDQPGTVPVRTMSGVRNGRP